MSGQEPDGRLRVRPTRTRLSRVRFKSSGDEVGRAMLVRNSRLGMTGQCDYGEGGAPATDWRRKELLRRFSGRCGCS